MTISMNTILTITTRTREADGELPDGAAADEQEDETV